MQNKCLDKKSVIRGPFNNLLATFFYVVVQMRSLFGTTKIRKNLVKCIPELKINYTKTNFNLTK